jgi:hypothetical protein
MRLRSTLLSTAQRCIDYLADNGPASTDELAAGVNIRRADVKRTMDDLAEAGTVHRDPSGRLDTSGRVIHHKVWHLSSHADLTLTGDPSANGTGQDGADETRRTVPPLRGVVRDGTPDGTAHEVLA